MKVAVIEFDSIPYQTALTLQRRTVEQLQKDRGKETLFLLEHTPVITVGRNAGGSSLLVSEEQLRRRGIEFAETDRGGDVTYHGPGQLVGYPILALEPQRRDIVKYVHDVEEMLIETLASFSIDSYRDKENHGVWTSGKKIASIGIRISRWVTSHGFALNVSTDLSHFSLMHPCGIEGCTMTSMENELGEAPPMQAVKKALLENFTSIFARSTYCVDKTEATSISAV
jgi:lipoate-protein ligase B